MRPPRPRLHGLQGLRPAAALRRLRPRTFRAQIVASTMVLMAVLVVAVGFVLQALLQLTAHHEIDTVLTTNTREVMRAVNHAAPDEVTGRNLDPGELVFYGDAGQDAAGSIEPRARIRATDLALKGKAVSVNYRDLRLRATPFTTPSGQPGMVVVSQVTTPYEKSEQYALVATIALGLIAVAATGLIARRVTSQALRPVREMAETASEWSETDLARRFDLGPPDNEIMALGETLDHLLERVARAIRAEQRLTSELAHELRTPLAAVQGSADLALLRGVPDDETRRELEQVATSARAMAETITTLLDVARELNDAPSDTCRLDDLLAAVRAEAEGRLALVVEGAEGHGGVVVAAPVPLCVRALAPVLDNAARFAASGAVLRVHLDEPGVVALRVEDDGPGLDPALTDAIFEPGASGSGGTGLGLAIARRVARSFGGDVRVAGAGGIELRVPRV